MLKKKKEEVSSRTKVIETDNTSMKLEEIEDKGYKIEIRGETYHTEKLLVKGYEDGKEVEKLKMVQTGELTKKDEDIYLEELIIVDITGKDEEQEEDKTSKEDPDVSREELVEILRELKEVTENLGKSVPEVETNQVVSDSWKLSEIVDKIELKKSRSELTPLVVVTHIFSLVMIFYGYTQIEELVDVYKILDMMR